MAEQRKPAWVSNELFAIWLNHQDTAIAGQPVDEQHPVWLREAVRHLLFDPKCAHAWRAIDKRFRRSRAPDFLDTYHRVPHFFDTIQHSYEASTDAVFMMSHEERREFADSIDGRVDHLLGALAKLTKLDAKRCGDQGRRLPYHMNEGISAAINQAMRHDPRRLPPAYNSYTVVVAMLKALKNSSKGLASTRPPVDGRSSNPARLYFVRTMTECMCLLFEEKLSAYVAAMANCLYPSQGKELNGRTVAQLVKDIPRKR